MWFCRYLSLPCFTLLSCLGIIEMARRESAPEPNELAGFGFGSITTCAGMSRGLYSLNDLPHLRVRNILVLPKQIACSCTGIGVLWVLFQLCPHSRQFRVRRCFPRRSSQLLQNSSVRCTVAANNCIDLRCLALFCLAVNQIS